MSEVVVPPARRIKRGWMNLKVDRIADDGTDTKTFYLVDGDEGGRRFDYIAGQYLTFRFDGIADKPLVRSYTMSSSPCEPDYVAFTVKKVEKGLISNYLCNTVTPGYIFRARGPIGMFTYDAAKDADVLVTIAGGSGVTPFVSMAREFASPHPNQTPPKKMVLLVSFRSEADAICWQPLVDCKKNGTLDLFTTLSRQHAEDRGFLYGRIDEAMLAATLAPYYKSATFMTCGPDEIMKKAQEHLLAAGVPAHRIKTESFAS